MRAVQNLLLPLLLMLGSSGVTSLKVAIIGAGPSGILLAHKLLQNDKVRLVSLYERRSRPAYQKIESSYVVGLGLRGRRAIQSVDGALWKAVEDKTFSCSKFILHIGPIKIKLRDGTNRDSTMLAYQSELCQILVDELDRRWKDSGRLSMKFDCELRSISLAKKYVETTTTKDQFDLVAGCDGNNSIVRKAIQNVWPEFESSKGKLPKFFKAVALKTMPSTLDPTAVNALAGKVVAAVEPTARGCCVLFQGTDGSDPLFNSRNTTELQELLVVRYPLLDDGDNIAVAARQLASMPGSFQAISVQCNSYHYDGVAALVGDAAHATVGQGMNAALVDSIQLAECLRLQNDTNDLSGALNRALLLYSQRQVPEGWALNELSYPDEPASLSRKFKNALRGFRDIMFGGAFGIGEPQLQTTFQTSLELFADIRRKRQAYYGDRHFPDQEEWNAKLAALNKSTQK